MNSVSRPQSAFNRLGSFTSLGVKSPTDKDKEQNTVMDLADLGYVYKQSQQMNHAMGGKSRVQINQLNFCQLQDPKNYQKYFGEDNRMLNGYITSNVELKKTLNYQVPNVSGQQILDIIPS